MLLVDEYLQASNSQSRELREYVERFLIGVCLGENYIPHAVRERVADFSGLSNVVVSEDRLQPWEQEFLERFERSELLEDLLTKAALKRNTAEYALIHGASWSRAFMLRLDQHKSEFVSRWLRWSDYMYREDGSFIDSGFRAKWKKLQRIEPLNPTLLAFYIALMVLSGIVLDALGAPLNSLLQLSTASIVQIVAGLAVLSWANFILVLVAKPVVRVYVSRVRNWLLSHVPLQVLIVESGALFLLIWGWALYGVLPAALSTAMVVISACILMLAGVFVRQWLWVNDLSFLGIGIRLLLYFFAVVSLIDDVARFDANTSSLWLVVGLVVWVSPLRAVFEREEFRADKLETRFSIRHTSVSFSLQAVRWFIGIGASVGLLVGMLLIFVEAPDFVLALLFGASFTLLAAELAVCGGLHEDTDHSTYRYKLAWVIFVIVAFGHNFVGPSIAPLAIQLGLCVFLLASAITWLSPKSRS